jgi:tRNA-intron endonuclease
MEKEERLHGTISRDNIVIEDFELAQELHESGFGDKEGKKLVLNFCEGLYLCNVNKLDVFRRRKVLSFDQLMETIYSRDKNVLTKFLVYRDLRSRGFVVKNGFGFGVDFRVYERGQYENKIAKYVVFVLNEGSDAVVAKVFDDIMDIKKMGKEAVVAVVDRRGELVYYQLSEAIFSAKKK